MHPQVQQGHFTSSHFLDCSILIFELRGGVSRSGRPGSLSLTSQVPLSLLLQSLRKLYSGQRQELTSLQSPFACPLLCMGSGLAL